MTLQATSGHTPRQAALLNGAAQWRDPQSNVRRQAREALRDGEWPAAVVEAALQNVLREADNALASAAEPVTSLTVLAIMPGNVLGPAIATAYCAAAAGASLMLKSSSRELHLADIVANQFQELGSPIAGTLQPMRWSGGDVDWEAEIFPRAERIVAFGDDETIADIRRRAPQGADFVAYGSAYSVGFVPAASDVGADAECAARDIAMFDQRGCLSPQTLYVEGDDSRAIMFGNALSRALMCVGKELPRASAGIAERAAISEFIRRLHVRAMPTSSHALGTVLEGPAANGYPEYVVGIEPYGSPVCAGFGRLVVVKPCTGFERAASAASSLGARLDSVGIGGSPGPLLRHAFLKAGALRVCALGEMQQPPFGYRPRISDFTALVQA